MASNNILYLSYDGMTDPLGQSQVLPYISGLAQKGYKFSLISFEKAIPFKENEEKIRILTKKNNIDWYPMPFSSKPPFFAKIYDQLKLKQKVKALQQQKDFALVHCRSYVSAESALFLKSRFGVKFLFDMRGFWVDERIDGKIWNIKNPFFKLAYAYYKKREAAFIAGADGIVSLTEAGKQLIQRWDSYRNAPVAVIPCSADFDLFPLKTDEVRAKAMQALGIKEDRFVLSYLGSVGTWYKLPEMLLFFKKIKQVYPKAVFLFLTAEKPAYIYAEAQKVNVLAEDLIIRFAERDKVSFYLEASDISISFIKPSYSKIASSPTKLGELFAKGIPVITNSGVGDVEAIVNGLGGGSIIHDFSEKSLQHALESIPALLKIAPTAIREKAFTYYNLQAAIQDYEKIYKKLLG